MCIRDRFFNVGNAGLFDFDTFCADPMNLAGDGCFTAPTCLDDSLALVALFNATDGPNWRTTWDIENDPYDTWFGVNVNVDGCVTGLDLINNDLTGELPPELGDLTEMISFNVTMNNLTGSLPVELGSWAVIQDFFVGNNNLSGNLPESYSNFVNLRQIVLQDNSLSGLLPSSWSNFTNSPNFNGVLNLRNNLLEGCYPQSYLAFCDFGENVRFEGNIDLNGDFSTFCINGCLLYTSPSPRDRQKSRMPSSA